MKNKILKTIALGAVCCVAALPLVGCSADISNDQIDKAMSAVEHLEASAKRLSSEDALNIYNYAYVNAYVNADKFMENCLVSCKGTADSKTTDETYFYFFKDESGLRIGVRKAVEYLNGASTSSYYVVYETESGEAYYYNSKDGEKRKCDSYEDAIPGVTGTIIPFVSLATNYSFDKGSVVGKINDNDDYEIIMGLETTNEGVGTFVSTSILTLTKDFTFKTHNLAMFARTSEGSSSETIDMTYEYGKVSLDDFREELNIAKAKAVEN